MDRIYRTRRKRERQSRARRGQIFRSRLTALLTVLMLRGPQTPGELRQRSERIHRFDSGQELERTLDELIERDLVAALPRRPGERGQRYAHRLSEVDENAGSGVPADRASAPVPPDRQPASVPAEGAAPVPADRPPAPVPAEGAAALPASPATAPDARLAARLERLEGEVAALREQLRALRAELGA